MHHVSINLDENLWSFWTRWLSRLTLISCRTKIEGETRSRWRYGDKFNQIRSVWEILRYFYQTCWLLCKTSLWEKKYMKIHLKINEQKINFYFRLFLFSRRWTLWIFEILITIRGSERAFYLWKNFRDSFLLCYAILILKNSIAKLH